MNLFVVGWSIDNPVVDKLESALRSASAVYPQLDPNTLSCVRFPADGNCLVSIQTATLIASPRRYLYSTSESLTMFSGLPIDSHGEFEGHDAKALCAHWPDLPDRLEGQFSVFRLQRHLARLELLTDPLGMEQVYYAFVSNGCVFSNNVSVLSRALGFFEPDELGTSLYVMLGWAGSDRTLVRDIRTLPGGQLWSFVQGARRPSQRTYFSVPDCASQEVTASGREIHEVAPYVRILRSLNQYFGQVSCGLTGGRDSRLLAVLLSRFQIDASFFTTDIRGSGDSEVATEIARALRLNHQVVHLDSQDLLTRWRTLSERLVQQNDGLVSLWQIADLAGQPQRLVHLKIMLHGVGGEIARRFYSSHECYVDIGEREVASTHLIRHAGLKNWVASREAVDLTERYIKEFVSDCCERGADPADVPDIFYAEERVRRWGGSNGRKALATCDRFPLFCSRPFVRAAFQLSPMDRWREQLHYASIHAFAPQISYVPFSGRPWRCESVQHLPRAYPTQPATQIEWLNAVRQEIFDEVMAHPTASLWEFVDKPRFEQVMQSGDAQAVLPTNAAEQLYLVATLFQYHNWLRNNV